MKFYFKPKLSCVGFEVKQKMASLNDWLNTQGDDYQQAGITTYILNS